LEQLSLTDPFAIQPVFHLGYAYGFLLPDFLLPIIRLRSLSFLRMAFYLVSPL